ncbi:MAG: hypothetical protein WA958_05390 [Tunicatimonas sp.]
MAKTNKAQRMTLSYSSKEVKQQIEMIPQKLDEVISAQNISYNRVAKSIGSRPEVLYRIRDGESLPSCETIINIKNVLPDLNLNWWLCNQGGPSVHRENERLRAEIDRVREELVKMKQQLSRLIDDTST